MNQENIQLPEICGLALGQVLRLSFEILYEFDLTDILVMYCIYWQTI
jgi:hypothetical protein